MFIEIQESRVISREGVNVAQAFFERSGCIFQEVALQNDFGKDAYVDLSFDGILSPLCIAVQIKSGRSFRSAGGDYFIPVEKHATNWRSSTVPVFGLVYDPSDGLLRWVDLTGYLRAHPKQDGGSVPVNGRAIVNENSLRAEFGRAVGKYAGSVADSIAMNLLSPTEVQTDAVYDAWALGRHDARYLIILRRLILDLRGFAIRRAIAALAHVGSHPDIFWTADNWIPEVITKQVLPCFRWSPDEISHMVGAIEVEEWGRGTLGQSLDVLMYEDPDVVSKLHAAVQLKLSDIDMAIRVATLALSHSRDARHELSLLSRDYPELMTHEWFQAVTETVQRYGWLSLY